MPGHALLCVEYNATNGDQSPPSIRAGDSRAPAGVEPGGRGLGIRNTQFTCCTRVAVAIPIDIYNPNNVHLNFIFVICLIVMST